MKIIINDDGLTHINVYSKAKTIVGQLLSNFAPTSISMGEHGTFASVEGYWYWLSTKDHRLRFVHGFQAKKLGRSIRAQQKGPVLTAADAQFRESICAAIRAKLTQHPYIVTMLHSYPKALPLVHYYVMQGMPVDRTEESRFMLDTIEEFR